MAISEETAGGSARPDPANGGYREHYIRDAQGNIMATYRFNPASLVLNDRPLYGSSRLGNYTKDLQLYNAPLGVTPASALQQGELQYELTDHLGNVAAIVTGALLPDLGTGNNFQAQLVSAQGYEPFGSLLPGRNYNSGSYRNLFQGQEHDDELYGSVGTSYAFEYRMHDAGVGRFLSIDPLAAKYPFNSPYAFSENRVIDGVDLEGREWSSMRSYDVRTGVFTIENEARLTVLDHSQLLQGARDVNPLLQSFQSASEQAFTQFDPSKGIQYTMNVSFQVEDRAGPWETSAPEVDKSTGLVVALFDQTSDVGGTLLAGAETQSVGNTQNNYINMPIGRRIGGKWTQHDWIFSRRRTVPHELGHTAGLYHPYDPDSRNTEMYNLFLGGGSEDNLMWQSGYNADGPGGGTGSFGFGIKLEPVQLGKASTLILQQTNGSNEAPSPHDNADFVPR